MTVRDSAEIRPLKKGDQVFVSDRNSDQYGWRGKVAVAGEYVVKVDFGNKGQNEYAEFYRSQLQPSRYNF